MLPDRVSNPGPLTYESGALPIALRGPAIKVYVIYNLLNRPILNMGFIHLERNFSMRNKKNYPSNTPPN